MKSKAIVVFVLTITAAISISLIGCNNSQSETANNSQSAAKSNASSETNSTDNSNTNEIKFDNAVIADDDICKMTLDEFYEVEYSNAVEKCMNISVQNKTDKDLVIYLSGYLNDEYASIAITGSGSTKIRPQKTNLTSWAVSKNRGANQSETLDSIEDMFSLNGEISLKVEENDAFIDEHNYIFDLSEFK